MVLNTLIGITKAIMGDTEKKSYNKSETKKAYEETRLCPNCGERVKKKAVRCVYCNYYFKKWNVTSKNESSYDTDSEDKDLNFKSYVDYKNDFCRHNSAKLEEPVKYCPKCNITFLNKEEKFCKFCKTKLINKYNNVSKSQKTKASKHNIPNNHDTKIDNPKDKSTSIEDDSLEAEFAGKTKEELERELKIATVRYEDCLKSRDYMTTYYAGRKRYLEWILNEY